MTDPQRHNLAQTAPFRAALYDGDLEQARSALARLMGADCPLRLCHPLGTQAGPDALMQVYDALQTALPDFERREWIAIEGKDEDGAFWAGFAGHYIGTLNAPWLGIPPTGHLCHMRFHEFYRLQDGQITEVQAIWDIPEVMMQAGVWPMVPSLGREIMTPGPASQDGLSRPPRDAAHSAATCQHVVDMLTHMIRHPAQGGPEVMDLPRFWHPQMNWYGPAGIGTARGTDGFRNWHQIPFLSAMPDRGAYPERTTHHFFADNAYCAVTGWPNMAQTISGDGWLGIAPSGQQITLRSLDFWRLENGLIRENWVLVDLLDMYHQIGIDVFARMHALTNPRLSGAFS